MANTFKNEKELNLNGTLITLRPSFETMAQVESKLGSIAYLAFKFAQFSTNMKNLPGLSELTLIIYHFQDAHDKDVNKTPLTINQVYDLVSEEGVFKIITPILDFLAQCTAGNKNAPDISDAVKKN